MVNQANIYAVFLSSGRPVGFESFRKYHPDVEIPNNSDILERIKKACNNL